MVLTGLIGELGLQKNVSADDDARAIRGSQSLANARFKIMAALIGGVDAPEAGAQR